MANCSATNWNSALLWLAYQAIRTISSMVSTRSRSGDLYRSGRSWMRGAWVIRKKQQAETADAGGRSAEERSDDAMQGTIASKARETEIAKAAASEQAKPPQQRATLPPTMIALNCERLRQA